MAESEKKELLLFQLGPVQEFIAQAETPGDLKAGSELLSELTAAALKKIEWKTPSGDAKGYWNDDVAVFPAVEKDRLGGIPNRFLVFVPEGTGESYARKASDAARAALKEIAEPVRTEVPENLRDAFDAQVNAFLQVTWAVLKKPTGNIGADYASIGKLMAMRRNVRNFDPWPEENVGQTKDFLSGREAALNVKGDRSNAKSARGAMNLIKAARAEKYRDLYYGDYIAVIALDGDRMGKKLSGFATEKEHRDFSKRLADHANNVKVNRSDGILVYAGGDDVLAVVRADRAFSLAQELADDFTKDLNNEGERIITASVGIAIGSSKAPLQDIVNEARSAESRAKRVYGRDALAVSILKRSGEILRWGCNWGSPAFGIYEKLAKNSERLSRFAYKLAQFLEPYELGRRDEDGKLLVAWKDFKDVVKAETLHAIKQTEGADDVLSEKEVEAYLYSKNVSNRPDDFLGLFLCEAFINRKRG